ncbi:MAG TPA: c-type cytochrome [Burkholderiales bacterium]|nr:c-type cytochrome [Burkholderiales bacterium]
MHRTKIALSAALIALAGIATTAQAAGNAAAGKQKAARCAGCHGQSGQGVAKNPPIAGMAEADFVKAVNDYKSGARNNAPMKGMTASLKPQDIEDLAAYYASLKK